MTPNKNHYRWYNDMTTGLTIFSDQESRSLESLHIDDWELSAWCSKHTHPFAPCPYCLIEIKDSLIDKLAALAEQLITENAELLDVVAKLTAELEKRPVELEY